MGMSYLILFPLFFSIFYYFPCLHIYMFSSIFTCSFYRFHFLYISLLCLFVIYKLYIFINTEFSLHLVQNRRVRFPNNLTVCSRSHVFLHIFAYGAISCLLFLNYVCSSLVFFRLLGLLSAYNLLIFTIFSCAFYL